MKSTGLLFIALTAYITVKAQEQLQNKSLTNPSLDILYIGVDNLLDISGCDTNAHIQLVSSGSRVTVISKSEFKVVPSMAAPDTFTLYVKGKEVLEKVFAVKRVSSPLAVLGNVIDTTATIKQILISPTLHVMLPGCYYKHMFVVRSFSAALAYNNGNVIFNAGNVGGNGLPVELRTAISMAKSGYKLKLSNIIITCPSCSLIRLSDVTITIK